MEEWRAPTSQAFSWLQKGQVNWVSSASMFFFLASGFLEDFRRPILDTHRLSGESSRSEIRN